MMSTDALSVYNRVTQCTVIDAVFILFEFFCDSIVCSNLIIVNLSN